MIWFLRLALLPVVLFCVTIVLATFDSFGTNFHQKATWQETVATVIETHDFGDVAAEFRGVPNDFPDPYGELHYAAGGRDFVWKGRGREIGLTAMKVGERISVRFDPSDPSKIGTLVQLGQSVGLAIFGAAVAFLIFYVWFFWLRGRGGGNRFLPPGLFSEGNSPLDPPPGNPASSEVATRPAQQGRVRQGTPIGGTMAARPGRTFGRR